jgi:hypothetical protein
MLDCIKSVTIAVVLVALAFRAPGQVQKPAPELHVVAIHESQKNKLERIGFATVNVDRPKQSVRLVLRAYNPTKWTVNSTNGSQIDEVILCGYHKQVVANARPDLKITELYYERPNRDFYIRGTYSKSRPEFRKMVDQLHQYTGQEIKSFTGLYRPEDDTLLRVDQVQTDARLLSNYPQPDWKGPLPELRFRAVDVIAINRFPRPISVLEGTYGEHTLRGPVKEKHTELPASVVRVAELSEKGKLTGIDTHYLYFFDEGIAGFERFDLSGWPSHVSWPKDIGFDSKNNKILVLAEKLVSLDPKSREATNELDGMSTRDWLAFAIGPKDEIIGLIVSPSEDDEFRPHIVVVDRKGKRLKRFALGDVFYPGVVGHDSRGSSAQMRFVDGHLVIVTGLRRIGREMNTDPVKYHYLVELEKGTTNLVWRSR